MRFCVLCLVLATLRQVASVGKPVDGYVEREHGVNAGEDYVSGKKRLLGGALGVNCVAWRKSASCDDPAGPRDPMNDQGCTYVVSGMEAGFCECQGHKHTAAFPCGHRPINCQNECGQLVPGFARPFPMTLPPLPDLNVHVEPMKPLNPIDYWAHEAHLAVEQAVVANMDGLADAKRMLDSIENNPPWKDVHELGSEIWDSGRKVRIFSKNVPPVLPLGLPPSKDTAGDTPFRAGTLLEKGREVSLNPRLS